MPWRPNKRGGYRTSGGGNVANPKQYEGLRKRGMSKSRAAAISNAKPKRKRR